jgi:hypothetical protein
MCETRTTSGSRCGGGRRTPRAAAARRCQRAASPSLSWRGRGPATAEPGWDDAGTDDHRRSAAAGAQVRRLGGPQAHGGLVTAESGCFGGSHDADPVFLIAGEGSREPVSEPVVWLPANPRTARSRVQANRGLRRYPDVLSVILQGNPVDELRSGRAAAMPGLTGGCVRYCRGASAGRIACARRLPFSCPIVRPASWNEYRASVR